MGQQKRQRNVSHPAMEPSHVKNSKSRFQTDGKIPSENERKSSDFAPYGMAVNRFYGDGLNKLEPKDVEDMPCPGMQKLSRAEAGELTRKLSDLEKLALDERTARIDEFVAGYFDTLHSGQAWMIASASNRSAQSPIARFARNSDRASVGTVGFRVGTAPFPPNDRCRS